MSGMTEVVVVLRFYWKYWFAVAILLPKIFFLYRLWHKAWRDLPEFHCFLRYLLSEWLICFFPFSIDYVELHSDVQYLCHTYDLFHGHWKRLCHRHQFGSVLLSNLALTIHPVGLFRDVTRWILQNRDWFVLLYILEFVWSPRKKCRNQLPPIRGVHCCIPGLFVWLVLPIRSSSDCIWLWLPAYCLLLFG